MEILDKEQNNLNEQNEMFKEWESKHKRGRIFGGLIFFVIGLVFLAREFGVDFPHWLFSWKILLIVIGLYVGIKHQFRNIAWLILIGIGATFLLEDFYPVFNFSKIIWPIIIMLVGLKLTIKPSHKRHKQYGKMWQQKQQWKEAANNWEQRASSEDYLEINCVFGSIKKNFISKNFKGGEINCVFSGSEVNLTNADFEDKVELEVNIVFGGASLIVPSNWEVRSELTAVLGGVEDKRVVNNDFTNAQTKVLILRGTAVFGGIEIKNF